MWSLSINDRTNRISYKCVNNKEKGGEEITEVLGDVALALQRRMCSLKRYSGCHENRYLYKKIIFIFIAEVLSWCIDKQEKLYYTFPCCWSSVACFPQHPLYFSVITWSSPSRRRAERTASPHTQPLPPKYLSQIDDVVQGPWLTTRAWTQFPHGFARIQTLAFGANDLTAINIYLQYVDSWGHFAAPAVALLSKSFF